MTRPSTGRVVVGTGVALHLEMVATMSAGEGMGARVRRVDRVGDGAADTAGRSSQDTDWVFRSCS